MSVDSEYIDITGGDAGRAPLVRGTVRAYYATGSSGIAETAAQVAAAKAAGMGVILIDQTPSLSVFAAGNADVADVENGAGTNAAAAKGVASRQARGQISVLYVSQGSWASLKAAIASSSQVYYWIANWSDSLTAAEAFIAANPDVVAVQFGDPNSNPNTLVPGTNITLAQANADIDVGRNTWLNMFLADPPPAPAPAPLAPNKLPTFFSATPYVTFSLGWGASPTASADTSYHVQIATANVIGGFDIVADTSTAATSYHSGTLPAGNYVWRLAVHQDAEHIASPWSPWMSV